MTSTFMNCAGLAKLLETKSLRGGSCSSCCSSFRSPVEGLSRAIYSWQLIARTRTDRTSFTRGSQQHGLFLAWKLRCVEETLHVLLVYRYTASNVRDDPPLGFSFRVWFPRTVPAAAGKMPKPAYASHSRHGSGSCADVDFRTQSVFHDQAAVRWASKPRISQRLAVSSQPRLHGPTQEAEIGRSLCIPESRPVVTRNRIAGCRTKWFLPCVSAQKHVFVLIRYWAGRARLKPNH